VALVLDQPKEYRVAARKSAAAAVSHQASLRGHVSETGRLSLPVELRRAVGLEKGGPVRIDLVDGAIRIRTMREIRDRIRALARESGFAEKASVADFLAWRADERMVEAGKPDQD